jgi:vesicular inhibitory amino acid transporter
LHFWLCPLVAALVRLARSHVPTTELLAATESFNSNLRVIVSITNNVGLFGVSVVFIILCAQNMTDLLQDLVPEMDQCLWTLVISVERPMAWRMNEIGQIQVVAGALCPLTWLGSPKEFW